MRCGEICSDSVVTNFLLILKVKNIDNGSIFEVISVPNFMGHPVQDNHGQFNGRGQF